MRYVVLMAALGVAASVSAQTGGRVTGHVRGEGGRPLSGEVTTVIAGSSVLINSFLTDEQGAFTIDVPAGGALLVARADGYVSEERQLLVRAGQGNATVEFRLTPAGSVSGRVFDKNGAGVAGARVWIGYRGEPRAWRLAEEAGGEATDEFGYFTIPSVAQGRPFVLRAESDEWLPSPSGTLILRAPEMTGVVLLLSRRGANVRGRVVDSAGNPVPGAIVHLRAMPADAEFRAEQGPSAAFARRTNRTEVSANDGTYNFAGVPIGRVVVTANARGGRAFREAAVAEGRETQIIVALP